MSLTKVSYSMIQGAPVNVLDYGADPTGSADSTAAINAALASGKSVYFPAGDYKVSTYVNKTYPDGATRIVAFELDGVSNISIFGDKDANINPAVPAGVTTERVLFDLYDCTSINIFGFQANKNNTNFSISGSAITQEENWIFCVYEKCTNITLFDLTILSSASVIYCFPQTTHTSTNISVNNIATKYTVFHLAFFAETDGCYANENNCIGTGRSWHNFGEDICFADGTTNNVASANVFQLPYGNNSRITPSNSVGPTSITANVKTGGGIFVELYSASYVTITGNTATNNVDTNEIILFTGVNNTGDEFVTISGNVFSGGGLCLSDYNPGTQIKTGLTITGNQFSDCQGVNITSPRVSVVVTNNLFKFTTANPTIWFCGDGTIFSNNCVINGYVKINNNSGSASSNYFRIIGNTFFGNFVTAITNLFDISGTGGHYIQGNRNMGGYTNVYNPTPSSGNYSLQYSDIGFSTIPSVSASTSITGVVGDTIYNSTPTAGGNIGWVCTTAGSPGTWKTFGAISA